MWGWKHVDRSLGTGAWGCEHGAWGWEHGDWLVTHFFLLSFVNFFWSRWDSEAIFLGWKFCQFFTCEDGSIWTGAWEGEHGDVTMLSWWNCHFLVVCFPTHFFLSYKFMITIYVLLYVIWFLILVDCLIYRITFFN